MSSEYFFLFRAMHFPKVGHRPAYRLKVLREMYSATLVFSSTWGFAPLMKRELLITMPQV